MMGRTDAQSYALLVAFESWLARAAARWELAQTARLSVEFLVAFGAELGPRLEPMVRVRTSRLTAEELATLRSPPFSSFVDLNALAVFQGQG